MRKLFALVNDFALELHKADESARQMNARVAKQGKSFSTKNSTKSFGKKPVITTFGVTVGAKRSADVPPRSNKQRKFARPPNTKKCFHCGEEHEFINCPTATDADKAAIRAKRREEYLSRKKDGQQQQR